MRKTIRNLIFFIVLIIITFGIVFKDVNISDILNILHNANFFYVIVAILCMCMFICCDAINIGRSLKNLKEKSTFMQNVKYSLIGFFFSSITPAASGGQPMQIYYMHKKNITVANSTIALILNLICVQIVTISLGIISMVFNYEKLDTPIIVFFIIGILLNLTALNLLLISIFSRRMTKWIIKIVVKIMKGLKIRNVEEKQKKLETELLKYQDGTYYVKKNKILILKTLLTTYAQYIFYYAIAYFTYLALGFSQLNIIQLIGMQAMLYGTVSGIPSPGAVGVSEGGYMSIFAQAYPDMQILSGAMLLTRGINFYLFVLISAVVVVINDIRTRL